LNTYIFEEFSKYWSRFGRIWKNYLLQALVLNSLEKKIIHLWIWRNIYLCFLITITVSNNNSYSIKNINLKIINFNIPQNFWLLCTLWNICVFLRFPRVKIIFGMRSPYYVFVALRNIHCLMKTLKIMRAHSHFC
jgi:hypothetical protein